MSRFIQANGLQLHVLDRPGGPPTLLLLPGLTANAHSFDGLIAAGLSPRFRTIAVDFRGRGLSEKPETGYRMADYCDDVLALLDELERETAVLCGHSFGALIGLILAAQHPDRFSHLIMLDSSHLLIKPETVELIKASLERLGKTQPSMEAYLAAMRQMPYLHGYWDSSLESYYRSDVRVNADGTVQTHATPGTIAETIEHEYAEPWLKWVTAVTQPVLLLNAPAPYGPPNAPPILSEEMARETAVLFTNCAYRQVPGNHVTMLFGENARHTVVAISDFGCGISESGQPA
jgi:pimeloyl-ACP methyl ester carboxylesterase